MFNLEKRSYRVFVSDLIDMLGNSIEKTLTKTWMNKTDTELTQQAGVDPKKVQEELKILHERKVVLGGSHRDVKEVQAILATRPRFLCHPTWPRRRSGAPQSTPSARCETRRSPARRAGRR